MPRWAWPPTHWCTVLGLGPDDRFQVATPPSHILGLLNLLAAVSSGATVRLHRRFDLDEVLRRIASERMTLEMAVAPIALALANHPHLEDHDLSSLRYIMWGATPVTESVAEIVTERTGVRWLPAYGASELPVIAANPVDRPEAWRLDSAGLPPDGVELRIADLDSGEILPPGEIGEIQVLSRSVMAGYLPDDATADAFADGWYRTGDVGWLEPEGWVHLTDRSKEMIKVNGFQVAPAEIEAVLLRHPAVLDCAVFGVADERAGEVPAAAVALDPARPVADGELQELVADSLATYKRLHYLVVVDEIPRLPSGKVLRRTLRDEWSAPLLAAPDRRLMDVRLSPEQQALRDAAARLVDRLGPHAVGELGDPERAAKLDAAVSGAGWRELRTAADGDGTAGVRGGGGDRRRGARPGSGRRLVRRADHGRRAPPTGRRAIRARRSRPSSSPPISGRWPSPPTERSHRAWPSTCRGRRGPSCSSPDPTVTSWPTWPCRRDGSVPT